MSNLNQAVVGIDLGTQGVRAIAVSVKGDVYAQVSLEMPVNIASLPEGWHEQNPNSWWETVCSALRQLLNLIPEGIQVVGLAVDSTSGSLVVIDSQGNPLYPAIMYNDTRSSAYIQEIRNASGDIEKRLGYAFSSSFALPKIVWFQRECPKLFSKAAHFLSATDFIVGRLTGEFGVSDYSNVLKTGFDLINLTWPDFLETKLGLLQRSLPRVIVPGAEIARTNAICQELTGLSMGTPVFAGGTDGTVAQFASGAVAPGMWNSTLGTTLVLKGISRDILPDPHQRIYCHRHPEGWWMPGGASNTGAEWILKESSPGDLQEMDQAAQMMFPTNLIRYPLSRKGERFPFVSAEAQGFITGTPRNRIEQFAAGLEGVALLEKMAFLLVEKIGYPVQEPIIATGGATRSLIWLQLRATILNRAMIRPVLSDACMGAAILAASGCWYNSVEAAVRNLVRMGATIEPDTNLVPAYKDKYAQFIQELKNHHFIITE